MGDASGHKPKPGFWSTLPGLITAIATLLTATGGLLGGLYAAGIIGPQTSALSGAAPIPTARAVNLPAPDLIYNQPVDEAVQRLEDTGFVVREADIGCSNSTEPGFVRQVTLGPFKNVHIIYGKVVDDIDEDTVEGLSVGDELTVWIPSVNPCP